MPPDVGDTFAEFFSLPDVLLQNRMQVHAMEEVVGLAWLKYVGDSLGAEVVH